MISLYDTNNRKRALICFLISLALLQIAVSVKAFNLRKINNAENLSSSSIFSFHQDKTGLIWIGTNRGIDIYDGKQIVNMAHKANNNFFTGSKVGKIEQDNNLLWLQTYHGLHQIDLTSFAIQSFEMFNRIAFWDMDNRGNIFLLQGNNCIYYKLKDQKQFEQRFIPGLREEEVADLFLDNSGRLWIFRTNGNNLCFSVETNEQGIISFDSLPGYKHPAGIRYCTNNAISTLYFVDETNTLYEFDTSTCRLIPVHELKGQQYVGDDITSLLKFHDDFFIGFKNSGLSLLRKSDRDYVLEDIDIPGAVSCLYKDKYQDMVWIGTAGHGVYTYSIDLYSIKSFVLNDFTFKIHQPVSSLFVDKNNTLWLGSKGDGILRIYNFQADKKIKEHRMELITSSNSRLPDNTILSFAESRHGNLWIGTEQGLCYYRQRDEQLIPIPLLYQQKNIASVSDVWEQDSLLWISTIGSGVIKAKLEWQNNYPVLTAIKQFAVRENDSFMNCFKSIYPENDSIIWCMNKGEGIFRLNTVTFAAENIRFEGNTANETNVIRKDYQGNYLIGTNSGLIKYNSQKSKALNDTGNFPVSSVYGLLADSYAGYWLSTNRGLIFYNTDTDLFRTYDHQDGLSVLEFNEGASFEDKNRNTLFFGGTNGFVSIQRNYFDEGQHYMPPVYFRTVTIRDKQYPVGNSLELQRNQNFFTISFSATDHLNGNSYSYYYKLDGNEKEWIPNGNSDAVSFADLHPGHYRLYVKYYNKVLGKESYIYKLDINILPPWYASGWAYAFYIVFALAAAGLAARIWMVYNRKKKEDRRQKMEQKHKEDIYESKLRFFTNISHEFCTPLTLIYGPCNRLMEQNNLSGSTIRYISVIRQNAERLNALIQDLIEFNRLESDCKQPVIVPLDITLLAGKLLESFIDMAESCGITLEKEISPFTKWNTDKDFITTILLNLLSNAFKYSDNEKIVRVRIGIGIGPEDKLCITVSNTGKGIAEKDIPALFDRYRVLHNFEQYDTSWSRNGLGLAISYNMIRLLGGTIEVESIPDEWTHFRIKLPYLATSATSQEDEEPAVSIPDYTPSYASALQIPERNIDELKPTLLVIDDETEILWLIYDIFKADFNVLTATGPAEATLILKETHPDLIISDVIMPVTSGLDFSRQLKQDETTAHIPLILLSARRDIEGQTEGLNAGAELYITKPFNVEYLKSSVMRLLERKESLREYFSSPLSSYTLDKGKFSHQEHKKFINDVLKIINRNLKNKDLSAHLIAEKMNIGLRTFYRKLEEIEDTSLAELINNCRLLKAADLLVKTKLTIDEIVFQSGFTNRSTFYRAFSKKYNCTPTEYRKRQTEEAVSKLPRSHHQ